MSFLSAQAEQSKTEKEWVWLHPTEYIYTDTKKNVHNHYTYNITYIYVESKIIKEAAGPCTHHTRPTRLHITLYMCIIKVAGLCNSSPCFDQLDSKTSNGYKKGDHTTAFQMTGPDAVL